MTGIFYFSSTGNSLYIAQKIKESNYYGKDTQNIVSALTQKQAKLKSEKKIGW